MNKPKSLRMAGVAVLTAATATLGFSGIAAAEPADDIPILIENLPGAAEALATGLQDAAATAQESQSAVETSAAVGEAVVAGGSTLVAGTEQFGALGLGLALGNAAVQQAAAPYLGAIDDPATAPDLLNPDDLSAFAENAQPAFEQLTSNLTTAAAEGLQGNLGEPGLTDPVTGTPSAVGNTFASLGAAMTFTEGTNFESGGGSIGILGLVAGSAVGSAAGDYIIQLEEGAAPAFEGAAPVTDPIVAALQGL